MKTGRSIYPLLSHHHILQGDPKCRIWHLSAPAEICQSFLRCSSPVTSPAQRLQKVSAPAAWRIKGLALLLRAEPGEKPPLLARRSEAAGFSLECSWCRHHLALPARRGSGERGRTSEGKWRCDSIFKHPSKTCWNSPARPRRSAGSARGWAAASSKETCCAGEGSHPTPHPVASSLLTLERHQRR